MRFNPKKLWLLIKIAFSKGKEMGNKIIEGIERKK